MLGEPAARQDLGEGRGFLSYRDKMCAVLHHFLYTFIIAFGGRGVEMEHFRERGEMHS